MKNNTRKDYSNKKLTISDLEKIGKEIKNNPNINALDISNNNISSITPEFFKGLCEHPNLITVNLEKNEALKKTTEIISKAVEAPIYKKVEVPVYKKEKHITKQARFEWDDDEYEYREVLDHYEERSVPTGEFEKKMIMEETIKDVPISPDEQLIKEINKILARKKQILEIIEKAQGELDLRGYELTKYDLYYIAPAIEKNKTLESVSLEKNCITSLPKEFINVIEKHPLLTEVCLDENEGSQFKIDSIEEPTIQDIYESRKIVSDEWNDYIGETDRYADTGFKGAWEKVEKTIEEKTGSKKIYQSHKIIAVETTIKLINQEEVSQVKAILAKKKQKINETLKPSSATNDRNTNENKDYDKKQLNQNSPETISHVTRTTTPSPDNLESSLKELIKNLKEKNINFESFKDLTKKINEFCYGLNTKKTMPGEKWQSKQKEKFSEIIKEVNNIYNSDKSKIDNILLYISNLMVNYFSANTDKEKAKEFHTLLQSRCKEIIKSQGNNFDATLCREDIGPKIINLYMLSVNHELSFDVHDLLMSGSPVNNKICVTLLDHFKTHEPDICKQFKDGMRSAESISPDKIRRLVYAQFLFLNILKNCCEDDIELKDKKSLKEEIINCNNFNQLTTIVGKAISDHGKLFGSWLGEPTWVGMFKNEKNKIPTIQNGSCFTSKPKQSLLDSISSDNNTPW